MQHHVMQLVALDLLSLIL